MNELRRPRNWALAGLVIAAGGLLGFLATQGRPAGAADHLDPPARTNPLSGGMDRAGDIADLFAWHQGSGASATLVAALTFDGPNMPMAGQAPTCDRDVLYGIHVSNDADPEPEFDVYARFGQDDLGNCFVQVAGIPGAGGATIVGAVGRVLDRGGVKVFAGLRDDPFFFDLEGFRTTSMTGTLSMIDDRDFFAGKNDTAIVVEMPLAAVSPSGDDFRVWATTARAGG